MATKMATQMTAKMVVVAVVPGAWTDGNAGGTPCWKHATGEGLRHKAFVTILSHTPMTLHQTIFACSITL
jgi:hypothetical protein